MGYQPNKQQTSKADLLLDNKDTVSSSVINASIKHAFDNVDIFDNLKPTNKQEGFHGPATEIEGLKLNYQFKEPKYVTQIKLFQHLLYPTGKIEIDFYYQDDNSKTSIQTTWCFLKDKTFEFGSEKDNVVIIDIPMNQLENPVRIIQFKFYPYVKTSAVTLKNCPEKLKNCCEKLKTCCKKKTSLAEKAGVSEIKIFGFKR